ncbi:restriction endonuclease subunit S [Vibrio vulnificus]|nr:restriction endonuclease subunit S [Vibrio vulnificus]
MSFDYDPKEFVTVPVGWECKRLVDCTEDGNISYGIVQPGQHIETGIPVLRVNNVNNGNLDLADVLKVSPDIEKKYKRTRLEGGEVLLTLVGSTGQSFVAPKYLSGWNVPRAIAVIRADKTIGANWINICLQSSETKHFLDVRANTTVQKTLNLKDVRDIPILIPPSNVKKTIEDISESLRIKIELNTQTNQTLEQIAQAIFKSWFVDFDPVKAKMETLAAGGSADDAELAAMRVISAKTLDELNSLKASNPEAFNKLAQTAALFPAAMQDSELGEIPEGWEVSDLASCTTELRRGISPKYIEEGGVLVINQKCIRNHTVDFSLARRNDSSKRKVDGREIAIGDVLVNSTGVGTLGRLAPIRFLNETTVADSHVTVVRANTTKISKSFLAGLMLTNEAYIEASGAGSTGQTELRKQVLEDIKFVKPLSAVDRLFDEIISNFNAQTAELEKQRVTLSLTRDVLLPKLLSGEIDLTSEVVE